MATASPAQPAPITESVSLRIDGRAVSVTPGTTILEAAQQLEIAIPVLCHDDRYDPVGVCRMCVVDVGARAYAAACVRPCEEGMEVTTTGPDLERHRATLTELLLSDQPEPAEDPKETKTGDNELLVLVRQYGLKKDEQRLPQNHGRGIDDSNPVIAVNHDACILCDRCVRACDDIQGNDVIGRSGKGYATRIAFDLNDPMGDSSCVTCGECVAACPTGALTNKPLHDVPIRPRSELRQVDTVCPYCGVGCALTYHVDDDRKAIAFAEGRAQPGSKGRLCVKGRYGWDYARSPQRLTTPLVRRDDAYPKGPLSGDVKGEGRGRRRPGGLVDYDEVMPYFREASWDEALDLIATRLVAIRDEHGPGAIAGFGSAKCSNEEAYLFQKLIRAGFGTNNVDHCTRLCHASSVAALFEGVGSAAVSTTYGDVINADVAILAGTNTTANHPVASSFFKQARRRGTKLIVVDPRREPIADHAEIFCQIKPGTDVAFYNGVMQEIIAMGLVDQEFIANRTSNYEALVELLKAYPAERAGQICGVSPRTIRDVARIWGEAGAAVIYWGMGISQHTTGTDNARCLIALCSITGQVGRPGTGLHPLRGQNNVQGASDSGLIPMFYPDYQAVNKPEVWERFEQAWGRELDHERGLTVTEIVGSALKKGVRGMYMMGENPFLSDPNINKVRKALSALDFLAVQDIFLTETAEFADVILPASSYLEKDGSYTNTDRRVQRGRKVLDPPGRGAGGLGDHPGHLKPGGPADELQLAGGDLRRAGLADAQLHEPQIRQSGADREALPERGPGELRRHIVLFQDQFNTADGLAHLVPAEWMPARELPSDEYPFVLNTGRLLEHWHTGSMTRRSFALDSISPKANVFINPEDAARMGIADGEFVRVSSRRGTIEIEAKISYRETPGSCFIPFHFREAAANLLTIDEIDPFGKIPEFKFCAVRVERCAVEVGG